MPWVTTGLRLTAGLTSAISRFIRIATAPLDFAFDFAVDFESPTLPISGELTATRTTTATVTDYRGVVNNCRINEARMVGLRRVENLAGTYSSSSIYMQSEIIAGIGTASTCYHAAGGDGLYHFPVSITSAQVYGAIRTGSGYYSGAVWVPPASDWSDAAAAFRWTAAGLHEAQSPFTPETVNGGAGGWIVVHWPHLCVGASIEFRLEQEHTGEVTCTQTLKFITWQRAGAATEPIPPYVSNGVIAAPWHGYGCDGVKYFDTDENDVPLATTYPNADRGYLSELAATNLAQWNDDFSNVFWTKSQVTPTLNGSLANGLPLQKLTELALGERFYITRNVGNLTKVCCSIYVNGGSAGRWVMLRIFTAPNEWSAVVVNHTTGAITHTQTGTGSIFTNIQSSVTTDESGVHRVQISADQASGQTIADVHLVNSATPTLDIYGTLIYPGDGTSFINVGGIQIEAQSRATSLIRTAGAAVARTADVPVITTSTLSGWDATQGAWLIDCINQRASTAADNHVLLQGYGTGAETLKLATDTTYVQLTVTDDPDAQPNILANSNAVYAEGDRVTLAVRWLPGLGYKVFHDGAQVFAVADTPILATASSFQFATGGIFIVRSIAYINDVTDAQLLELTDPASTLLKFLLGGWVQDFSIAVGGVAYGVTVGVANNPAMTGETFTLISGDGFAVASNGDISVTNYALLSEASYPTYTVVVRADDTITTTDGAVYVTFDGDVMFDNGFMLVGPDNLPIYG